ncbi:MAG: hypothetical protein WDZ49_07070 [Litorilinea sp.]
MGVIRIIGDGPPAAGAVTGVVEKAIAAMLARHAPAFRVEVQPEEPALNHACRPSEPVLHIYLNAPPAPSTDCHARLVIVGPDAPELETVDSVYKWPGNGADSGRDAPIEDVFGQWLALGVALAQARYAADTGRRQLAGALLDSQRKIAKEIHGGAVQELVAGTFLLGLIPDGAGEPVLTQIQSALADLRTLCQRLNPPALDDFGLVAALRTGIRSYQRMGTDLDSGHASDHASDYAGSGNPTGESAGQVEFPVEFSAELPELASMPARTLYWVFDQLLATLLTGAPPATISGIGLGEDADGVVMQVAWVAAENDKLPSALLSLFNEMVAAVDGRMAYADGGSAFSLQVWMPLPG